MGTPAPEGSDALISVLVTGEVPDEELQLEIAGVAWLVTDGAAGSAGLSAPDPQPVRLLRLDDCEELASFEAEPGSGYAIVFGADGSASVEDRADQDAGGPLVPSDRAGCA
jgi:hypothetical protein